MKRKPNHILIVISMVFGVLVSSNLSAEGILSLSCHSSDPLCNYVCPFDGPYIARIEDWIWCKPGAQGQIGAQFAIEYPNNAVQVGVDANDEIMAMSLGDLQNGIGYILNACQYDWHWSYHQTIWIVSHELTVIKIIDDPNAYPAPDCQFINCQEGYQVESVRSRLHLYLNSPGWCGAECIPPEELVGTVTNQSIFYLTYDL